MKIIKPIIEAEMICSFLRAELLGSSRFAHGSERALEILKLDRKLITNPDYTNSIENKNRAKILGLTRGWPDKYLFTGFSTDIKWYAVDISNDELADIWRLKSSTELPASHRPISWVAEQIGQGETVDKYDNAVVKSTMQSIEDGRKLEPVIAVAEKLNSKTVLVEGHSRAVAYCLAGLEKTENILGISKHITKWEYF
jgi:hypothetical protein